MGKGSTILGLLGLIAGASALGLGTFAWITASSLENQVVSYSEQMTWYKYNGTTFSCIPPFTYIWFKGLTIEFELGHNESVFFSFTSRAHTEPVAEWSQITIYFRIDGLILTNPNAVVGTYNGAHTANFMINLQTVRDNLSPGDHTVSVLVYGTTSANYIYESTLFVQKVLT